MKQIISISILIFGSFFSFAQNQNELNIDAHNQFKRADEELRQVYSKIINEYKKDTVFIKNFKKSQRLWIQFRDAEMNVKYSESEKKYYGSVWPMCWSLYKTELTTRRINELKVWINGVEEGDVCAGSVKIKAD